VRGVFLIALAACTHDPPQQVTLPTAPSASTASTATDVNVSPAQAAFDAGESLQRDGKKAEARAAFRECARHFPYSRFGKEAELRIAQIDDSPEELGKWAIDHRSDERAAGILAKLDTVGDVTCRTDADCVVTTKRDCCECCPRRALATSKTWLAWRDTQQCATTRCIGCEESCKPETGAHVACNAGKCALTP